MDEFDPFQQLFQLQKPDGQHVSLDVATVNEVEQENLGSCINYGSQIGASLMMLLALLAMTPSIKLVKVSTWIHLLTLVTNTIRMTLLAVYFTSNWANFYSYWAEDYSRITPADFWRSAATETMSLILLVLIQVSLGIQAWALVDLLPAFWKFFFTGLSCIVSMMAISLRVAACVVQIESIMNIAPPDSDWVTNSSTAMSAVSIFYYCTLFNVKLFSHMVKNREIIPSRQGLSAVEVLVITNGLLMIVPAIFAALHWGNFTNFEMGSITCSSVVVFLPMGSLVASRVSNSTSQRSCCCTTHSSSHSKFSASGPSLHACGSAKRGVSNLHVESANRARDRNDSVDPVDIELQRISESGKGVIRVNREIKFYEERI